MSRYAMSLAELARFARCSETELEPRLRTSDENRDSKLQGRIDPATIRNYLTSLQFPFSFRTIAHVNLKGGIGKTTCTVSLATRAAQYGFKTCVLDLDPQGSASLALDCIPEDDDPIFYDVWQKPEEMLIPSLRRVQDNLHVLPSSLQNSLLDSAMANPVSQKRAVRQSCEVLREKGFDLVLMDCPPSLGTAVISSICAADTVVIPVWNDPFAIKGMRLTMAEVAAICETYGIDVPACRILFSRFDSREKRTAEAWSELERDFTDALMPVRINTSSEFSRMAARQESIFAASLRSRGRDDFDAYARLILGLDSIRPQSPSIDDFVVAIRRDNALIVKEVAYRDRDQDTENTSAFVRDAADSARISSSIPGGKHE